MALVTLPRQLTVDINGEPRVGARLSVLNAGTNNTRIAYSTKDYTIELSQPIESLEGGIFPAIYVNPDDGDYKLVITDSDGAGVYSEDYIPAKPFNSNDIGTTLDSLKQTPAEISAGVIPVNLAYREGEAERYGFSQTATAQANSAAVAAANSVFALSAVGGRITLPRGTFTWNGVTLSPYVKLQGAGKFATRLNYASADYAFRLGNDSNSMSSGIGVSDLAIYLSHKDGSGILGLCTQGAVLENLYIEGANATVGRTNKGVVWSAGAQSSFFNRCTDVECNHMENSFTVTTDGGGSRATCQLYVNCTAQGDYGSPYATSPRGLQVLGVNGDGLLWLGGNFEKCNTGIYVGAGALQGTVIGARFETNLTDINLGNVGTRPWCFIGCALALAGISDGNFIGTTMGCTQAETNGLYPNRFGGPAGVKSTLKHGSVTFSAATTAAVTFTEDEADALYDVWIQESAGSGTPLTYRAVSQAVGGFTVSASSSTSNTVKWLLIR